MKSILREEKFLWKKGYKMVAGLDEAGRGPLAGPVVAAAVIVLPENFKKSARRSSGIFGKNSGLRDSKKLSEKQRENFYKEITSNKNIKWGVGIVSEKIIDRVNILEATKLAMKKALLCAVPQGKLDFLILDGNFTLQFSQGKKSMPQKAIVAADDKVFSCMAAGIIAKVTRDKIMNKMHLKYPEYGFDKHKGYGTKMHIETMKVVGPSKIHRKSFWPVSGLAKNDFI